MVQAIFITLLPLQKTFSSCASVSCCFTDDWSLRLPHLNVMPPLNFYVGLFYKKKKKKLEMLSVFVYIGQLMRLT